MASIKIVDPVTGADLLAGATLSNCYLLIANQIFTVPVTRARAQHTDFLRDPIMLDSQSYACGLSLLTNATKGQIHRVEISGNRHKGGFSKTT
jgi:hypothetical protein